MADESKKPTCFIAMPVSTPKHLVAEYGDDADHFEHVLNELFIPAIELAGMTAIPPITDGSENIHANIISALQSADLVLVDLSSLNPNVFFEFGVRTSLNKPACPIRDEKTPMIPFDTGSLNTPFYSSRLDSWITKVEIPKLAGHIRVSTERSAGTNSLWKHFGFQNVAQAPEIPKSDQDKLDIILQELRGLNRVTNPRPQIRTDELTVRGITRQEPLTEEVQKAFDVVQQYRHVTSDGAGPVVKMVGGVTSLESALAESDIEGVIVHPGLWPEIMMKAPTPDVLETIRRDPAVTAAIQKLNKRGFIVRFNLKDKES